MVHCGPAHLPVAMGQKGTVRIGRDTDGGLESSECGSPSKKKSSERSGVIQCPET